MRPRRLPFVKLPQEVDATLFLIREELKATRFFNSLAGLGMVDCFYQPHLGSLVLANIGFADIPDDLFNYYSDLIDRESELIEEDMTSLTNHALRVYRILLTEKEKRLPLEA